jgi:116 kDa U5 small nuclear ribonucleoprotein component N-terminus
MNTTLTDILLDEDIEHYMSVEQVYGNDVTVAILDEDAMDLDQPTVETVMTKTHQVTYDTDHPRDQQQQQKFIIIS